MWHFMIGIPRFSIGPHSLRETLNNTDQFNEIITFVYCQPRTQ